MSTETKAAKDAITTKSDLCNICMDDTHIVDSRYLCCDKTLCASCLLSMTIRYHKCPYCQRDEPTSISTNKTMTAILFKWPVAFKYIWTTPMTTIGDVRTHITQRIAINTKIGFVLDWIRICWKKSPRYNGFNDC